MRSNIVILDANFILLPYQFKVDYLEEILMDLEGKTEFIVYKQILNELEAKRKREPNATKYERLLKSGLDYLDKKKNQYIIKILDDIKDEKETTDNFLLRKAIELSKMNRYIFMATNDYELKKKLKINKINRIFLRQRQHIQIERS